MLSANELQLGTAVACPALDAGSLPCVVYFHGSRDLLVKVSTTLHTALLSSIKQLFVLWISVKRIAVLIPASRLKQGAIQGVTSSCVRRLLRFGLAAGEIAAMAKPYCCEEAQAAPWHERGHAAMSKKFKLLRKNDTICYIKAPENTTKQYFQIQNIRHFR